MMLEVDVKGGGVLCVGVLNWVFIVYFGGLVVKRGEVKWVKFSFWYLWY